eukprot:scaffold674256_cov94-Prasinocladus_malaysianus.AAC.1
MFFKNTAHSALPVWSNDARFRRAIEICMLAAKTASGVSEHIYPSSMKDCLLQTSCMHANAPVESNMLNSIMLSGYTTVKS